MEGELLHLAEEVSADGEQEDGVAEGEGAGGSSGYSNT